MTKCRAESPPGVINQLRRRNIFASVTDKTFSGIARGNPCWFHRFAGSTIVLTRDVTAVGIRTGRKNNGAFRLHKSGGLSARHASARRKSKCRGAAQSEKKNHFFHGNPPI